MSMRFNRFANIVTDSFDVFAIYFFNQLINYSIRVINEVKNTGSIYNIVKDIHMCICFPLVSYLVALIAK